MTLDADSDLVSGFSPSPNFGPRKNDAAADTIILHYTGMPSAEAALRWLSIEESQVSCHYFIHADGSIIQLVSEDKRAWHAGRSFWQGNTDLNSCSIGIEIHNPGHEHGYEAFPQIQIDAVIALCDDICSRRSIAVDRVLAHSDIAPDRKQDPGELFPWHQLAAEGLCLYTPPHSIQDGPLYQEGDEGQPIRALQTMFALVGYNVEVSGVFDRKTVFVVTAFQRRFRPERVDGIADLSTLATLNDVVRLQKT
ncbi:peptidoglycan recognition protein family protein [Coralliovum pocilloporae]|uniref:peptidoglycan recognition protein family protein n=1 Tax=Coralliovum pocilloporae TaxID=3066369 RepID=UPI003306E941